MIQEPSNSSDLQKHIDQFMVHIAQAGENTWRALEEIRQQLALFQDYQRDITASDCLVLADKIALLHTSWETFILFPNAGTNEPKLLTAMSTINVYGNAWQGYGERCLQLTQTLYAYTPICQERSPREQLLRSNLQTQLERFCELIEGGLVYSTSSWNVARLRNYLTVIASLHTETAKVLQCEIAPKVTGEQSGWQQVMDRYPGSAILSIMHKSGTYIDIFRSLQRNLDVAIAINSAISGKYPFF